MNNKKLPSIIVLFILTVITVLFLTTFSVYRVFVKKTTVIIPENVLLDINPTLDKQTIETIKNRL